MSHHECFNAFAERHKSNMIGTLNDDQKVAFETVIAAADDASLPHCGFLKQ